MHPFVMELLAQQRLRNLRPGNLVDVPEHLRDDVWAAWALSYTGPGPILRWFRRLIAAVRPAAPQVASTVVARSAGTATRPAAAVTRPAAVLAGRTAAVIGCRV